MRAPSDRRFAQHGCSIADCDYTPADAPRGVGNRLPADNPRIGLSHLPKFLAMAFLTLTVTACSAGAPATAPSEPGGSARDPSQSGDVSINPPDLGAPATAPSEPATTGTSDDLTGGWLDKEPDWSNSRSEEDSEFAFEVLDSADGSLSARKAEADTLEWGTAADEDGSEFSADAVRPGSEIGIYPPPTTTPGTGQKPQKLTGGSIDDNENFAEYLLYRQRFQSLGIAARDIDPTGRIVLTITGQGGLPVSGTQVVISAGGVQTSLRTTADGTVRFHPEAHGASTGPFTATAGNVSVQTGRGQSAVIATGLPTAGSGAIPLDVLFLLDATGSMEDEIDQLKATITTVAQRIAKLPADVSVRLAMTLYRDQGDSFVTSTFDFTSDISAFAAALAKVTAEGGGDYPEALDEALAEALAKPSWLSPDSTVQLVFLVADAPPQISRNVQTPYDDSMIAAAERGIKILPISSSGTDDQAEYVFRQLAQFTGGRYVFLTYGAAGKATGTSTDITERGYEELSLDDLIVRTISEELEALTTASTAATASAATTTIPEPPTTTTPTTLQPATADSSG